LSGARVPTEELRADSCSNEQLEARVSSSALGYPENVLQHGFTRVRATLAQRAGQVLQRNTMAASRPLARQVSADSRCSEGREQPRSRASCNCFHRRRERSLARCRRGGAARARRQWLALSGGCTDLSRPLSKRCNARPDPRDGQVFPVLYLAVQELRDGSFFAQPGPHAQSEYVYFSFVALTTLGFGDLSPAVGLPQALTVLEALLGQVFLVTLVARLVTLWVRQSDPERDAGGA
jgi:hypothetical protein